ncbi:hypothetical protein HYW54_04690, partial [Candidatus Gottesmanbacteria bacterium]|nr:hypothetical protein [Candidatus Gottesmanbacteria bacterium]
PSFAKASEGKGDGVEGIEAFWLFWDLPRKKAPVPKRRRKSIDPIMIRIFLEEEDGGGEGGGTGMMISVGEILGEELAADGFTIPY